jgi:spore maturation protein CgeB
MLANRMVIADRPDKDTQIEQIFVEGKDIVYFDSLDDLIEKVNYYTVNEDKRLEIATAGFNKVSKYHTATARVRSLLKHL